MANYQYSYDIKIDALFRGGEPIDGTSEFDGKIETWINRAYQAVVNGGDELQPGINEDWWWALNTTPGVLTLEPRITTGTANVTNNSATVTMSSGPSATVKDWYFKVDDHADVFRVSAHTGGSTTVTLDSVYTGATDTTANYKLFKLEYDLAADMMWIKAPMRAYQDGRYLIHGMDIEAMDQQFPLAQVNSGVPRRFAMLEDRTVRFSHYGGTSSTDFIRLDYSYGLRQTVLSSFGSSDTEEPLVPHQYRKVLADFSLMWLMQAKSDADASTAATMAANGLRAMAVENRRRKRRFSHEYARIVTRRRIPNRREPLRTESGLIIS
jgi:hypothetical protein